MELTIWHIITGLSLIINILFLIVGWFVKKWMSDMETKLVQIESKQQDLESEMNSVRMNYNEKFKSVELTIERTEKNIIREISELKTHITESFVPKSFCQFIQEHKPRGSFE